MDEENYSNRKDAQCYDDGSRRKKLEPAPCRILFDEQNTSTYQGTLLSKLARLGGLAMVVGGLTFAGLKCANSYLEAEQRRESAIREQEQERKTNRDPELNKIYEGWEKEAKERK